MSLTQSCGCEFSSYFAILCCLNPQHSRVTFSFPYPTIHFLETSFSILFQILSFIAVCPVHSFMLWHLRSQLSTSQLHHGITQAYAIAVGGVFLILLSISFLPYLVVLMEKVSLGASRYLTPPQFLRRHRYLGPWAWADVLIQLTYITINIFCVSFQASSV